MKKTLTFAHHGEKIRFKVLMSQADFAKAKVSGTAPKTYIPDEVVTISGKSASKYQTSHLFDLPKPGSHWSIRMTRITDDDADDETIVNKTYFDSYVLIKKSRLSYPNTAMAAVTFSAEQFSSIPERSYLVGGIYIRVPSNYNEKTNAYVGVWNGTYKTIVSGNPAWVLFDILTSRRYGLGRYIREDQIDVGQLYAIGRYCDEMVSTGLSDGSMEKRFEINTVIQTRADAYRVISDICSVFRGMAYWNGDSVSFMYDAPTEETAIFSPSNVIGGAFTYKGSARKDRHSVVLVRWNDPDQSYKQVIEYVEDPDLIAKIGVRQTDYTAFGCASQGQAHRAGLWVLYSEAYEMGSVTFDVGMDSAMLLPGEVIRIHDPFKAGKRLAGRVINATANAVKLDSEVALVAGSKFCVRLPDGTFASADVANTGKTDTVSLTTALSVVPDSGAMWLLIEPNLKPMLARVTCVAQGKNAGEFSIAAVEHNPSKFDAIEKGMRLSKSTTTALSLDVVAPSDVSFTQSLTTDSFGITVTRSLLVSWSGSSPTYEVAWRAPDGSVMGAWNTTTVSSQSFEIADAQLGSYDFRIVGKNGLGSKSSVTYASWTVTGQSDPSPIKASGLEVEGGGSVWTGRDLNIVWRRGANAAQEFGADGQTADEGGIDPLLKDYIVSVLDVDGSALRTEYVTDPSYCYSYEKNCRDGGPRRSVQVAVWTRYVNGRVSASATRGTFTNPQQSISDDDVKTVSTFNSISVTLPQKRVDGSDFAGYIVWCKKGNVAPAVSSGVTETVRKQALTFDETRYRSIYGTEIDATTPKITALDHYRAIGWKKHVNPNAYLDGDWYLTKYPDAAKTGLNPFDHYVSYGYAEGKLPNGTTHLDSDDTTKVYEGPLNSVLISDLTPASVYTLVCAAYDNFERNDAVLTVPIKVETGMLDVGAIIDGSLTAGKLSDELKKSIDLIIAGADVPGSVASQVQEVQENLDAANETIAAVKSSIDAVKSSYLTKADADTTYSTKTDTTSAIAEAKTQAVSQAATDSSKSIAASLASYMTKADTTSAIAKAQTEAIAQTDKNTAGALGSYMTKTDTTAAIAEAKTQAIAQSGTNLSNALQSFYTSAQTDSAISKAKTEVLSTTGTNLANALSSYMTKTDVSSAISTAKTETLATTGANLSNALSFYMTKTETNSAIATAKTEAIAQSGTNLSNALSSYSTTTAMNSAIATARTEAISSAAGATANALMNYYTSTQADAAISRQVNQVSARLDSGDYAAVKTQASATAASLGAMSAKYTVNIDSGGNVSGFGLMGTSSADSSGRITFQTEFGVYVDKFWVKVNGGNDAAPFLIQNYDDGSGAGLRPTVFLRTAMIQDSTITTAKIADVIQSLNYSSSGKSGWKIQKSGAAEFYQVSVVGSFQAQDGFVQIGAQDIAGGRQNYIRSNSKSYGDGTSGFVFAQGTVNGSAWTWFDAMAGKNYLKLCSGGGSALHFEKSNGTVMLHIGDDGTAKFGGVLSAEAVDAVQTINIANQAVTVPIYAQSSPGTSTTSNYTTFLSSTNNTFATALKVVAQVSLSTFMNDGSIAYVRIIASNGATTLTSAEMGFGYNPGTMASGSHNAVFDLSAGTWTFSVQVRHSPGLPAVQVKSVSATFFGAKK